ncbi:MAG: type II toxin-antitoxin system RatA family toxin [Alphaproteobacteria bacterium]|nr:type II toxin-antitoxin system RatA family toxin [Alphaproteobacteria bacterium]
MPHAEDTRAVPYSAGQMYDLVADVRRYPEFLPWCQALRVRSEDIDSSGAGLLVADMVARFKGFEERFTSRVSLRPAESAIDVAYVDGPFRHLTNTWRFQDIGQGRSRVAFTIDFEFRSRLLQLLANSMLERALMRLSQAFIDRADVLYGATGGSAPSRPLQPT